MRVTTVTSLDEKHPRRSLSILASTEKSPPVSNLHYNSYHHPSHCSDHHDATSIPYKILLLSCLPFQPTRKVSPTTVLIVIGILWLHLVLVFMNSNHLYDSNAVQQGINNNNRILSQEVRRASSTRRTTSPSGVLAQALNQGKGKLLQQRYDSRYKKDYQHFVIDESLTTTTTTTTTTATATNSDNVVVFVCNSRYSTAVVMSIVSLRFDGGYTGDVAVILEQDVINNVTKETLKQQIKQGLFERLTVNSHTNNVDNHFNYYVENKTTQSFAQPQSLQQPNQLFIFTVHDLLESLFVNQPKSLQYLQNPPPLNQCKDTNRQTGHTAYYHKTLIYHPTIALRWKHVLYLDSCMTFHLPYVDWIFDISAKQQPNKLLAILDPWRWRKRKMIKGQLLSYKTASSNNNNVTNSTTNMTTTTNNNNTRTSSCQINPHDEWLLRRLVLENEYNTKILNKQYLQSTLSSTAYFNSAFILYDTTIIRQYVDVTQSTTSTIIEIMILYHLLGKLFIGGDQVIQSIYWMYLRNRNEFSVFENEFWDDGNIIPYTFEPPIKPGSTQQKQQHHQQQNQQQIDIIITNGNMNRSICVDRPVNKALFMLDDDKLTEEQRIEERKRQRIQKISNFRLQRQQQQRQEQHQRVQIQETVTMK